MGIDITIQSYESDNYPKLKKKINLDNVLSKVSFYSILAFIILTFMQSNNLIKGLFFMVLTLLFLLTFCISSIWSFFVVINSKEYILYYLTDAYSNLKSYNLNRNETKYFKKVLSSLNKVCQKLKSLKYKFPEKSSFNQISNFNHFLTSIQKDIKLNLLSKSEKDMKIGLLSDMIHKIIIIFDLVLEENILEATKTFKQKSKIKISLIPLKFFEETIKWFISFIKTLEFRVHLIFFIFINLFLYFLIKLDLKQTINYSFLIIMAVIGIEALSKRINKS